MKIIHKKTLYITLFIITLIILIIFSSSLKNSYLRLLELDLKKTELNNSINYYRNLVRARSENNADHQEKDNLNLEEKTAELIAKSAGKGLELIHYSSSREEIILNLKGDFQPFFSFLSWLEDSTNYLEIDNLKLKKDGSKLFCYLRLVKDTPGR